VVADHRWHVVLSLRGAAKYGTRKCEPTENDASGALDAMPVGRRNRLISSS
jgi:hypothetical protein